MTDRLAELENRRYDVLIVGGGIVGAGVARDAAMRGLQTLLVEQADFASGTSSRSSRLLHGGLRYLAQGNIGLVREASREKMVLQEIAPHLTQPLAFVFPAFRGAGWPRWQLWLGTKLYDLLCGGRNFGSSRALSRQQVQQELPGILASGLRGAVRYYDALTHDARLVIDTLRSAALHGARLENHMRLESARPVADGWQCQLVDNLNQREIQVASRSVVNASGPWSDQIPHSHTTLRLTKGVHLVIPRDRLPVPDAVVMPDHRRILFAIPWGHHVVLGTTDTDYRGPLSEPQCDPADLRSVLDVVNRIFPLAGIGPDDVQSTWAGLRPLVADRKGAPSDTSRRHEIKQGEPGWWDVTGGKLTTYRRMAEETVDQLVRSLKLSPGPCRTAVEPLLPQQETVFSSIIPAAPSLPAVQHYCRNEWAVHLDDVMLRRTSWRYGPDSAAVARQVAGWMAETLKWDQSTTDNQIEQYDAMLRQHCDLINAARH
jgi:glycerol-3-phosphate dehydrogenase